MDFNSTEFSETSSFNQMGGADNFSATSSMMDFDTTEFSETSSFNHMGGADNFSAISSMMDFDTTEFSETSSFNQMGGSNKIAQEKINNMKGGRDINSLLDMLASETEQENDPHGYTETTINEDMTENTEELE